MQDVDEQAAGYCRQRGLSYRRTEAVSIGPALKRVAYECALAKQPLTPKLEVRRTPTATPKPKTASDDHKVAAWTNVKAATDAWALCLQFDAERRAKETTEEPQVVAQEVVSACSGLERAVHEALVQVGEDSGQFQAELHVQAVGNASETVTSIRKITDVPVPGSPAF
jgi:hypothetical protein